MIHVLCGAAAVLAPLAAQQPTAATYVLDSSSRLEVRTGKAGLLGFAGHEHVIVARGFTGRIVYGRGAPAQSQVTVTVPAAELEVLTPPDTAERRKVRAAMQSDVLDVSRYPEIRLVSRTVQQVNDTTLHLVAALTIKDSTRLVPIAVRLAFAGDTLRAAAVFSIKQTDFGVRPYRGGPGGTVRVADKVTFDIHAVAIRR